VTTQSFRRILELLEQHQVDYVIVGGVAAVLQGAPVTTFDIDALFKVDDANIERLEKVLSALNARYREHRNLRPTKSDLAAGGHMLLMTDAGPFDVLGFIGDGRRYEDVADSVQQLPIDGLNVRVLSIEALIAEKKKLGREKDLIAVRVLEAVLRRRDQD
jgi:predicted nucleotidyltransferase